MIMKIKCGIEHFHNFEMQCDFQKATHILGQLTDSVSGLLQLLPNPSGLRRPVQKNAHVHGQSNNNLQDLPFILQDNNESKMKYCMKMYCINIFWQVIHKQFFFCLKTEQ